MAARRAEDQRTRSLFAAVSLNEAGHPIHAKITPVAGFGSEAVATWARENLSAGSALCTDGLACFRSVTTAGCSHEAIVTGGKHPNDLPQFRWINTVFGNLKTSHSGTVHAFNFDKYARRYLGGYYFRFSRSPAEVIGICPPEPGRPASPARWTILFSSGLRSVAGRRP